MHEITHGLLHSIGQVKLRWNEVLVEGLSQQLVGFIRDNKDLKEEGFRILSKELAC